KISILKLVWENEIVINFENSYLSSSSLFHLSVGVIKKAQASITQAPDFLTPPYFSVSKEL
ncbi:MAG: hypothetical protein ACYSPI_04090, partial [Planctomycetota bacterium]